MRKKHGKEGNATLVRDAKSKLPTLLRVVTPKETTEIRLSFKARKVDDKEVAIDPESYKDFERVVVDETDSKRRRPEEDAGRVRRGRPRRRLPWRGRGPRT